MFCAPALIFGGTEGVGSRFHVLRARSHFWRYRGPRVPFSCFALPNSFSTVSSASGSVFMFCALGFVFGGTEGVASRFHVLRARTHFRLFRVCRSHFHVLCSRTRFRRCRVRRVSFSCFARPDSFSIVPRAPGPVFMFCAPRLIFGVIEGVASRFHVLRAQTRFRRYRVRRVPFSWFERSDSFSAVPRASGPVFTFCAPDSFSMVPRASGPVFMFCAPGIVFGGTEGVGSRFHVLRARSHFWRYRGPRVPFSCFARPNSFSTVTRASGPVFMFCAP
jgi:hypothetical protein